MSPSRPLSVLVVDDHADMRYLVRLLLAEHPDIEVVGEAATARAALERLEELEPDVVVLDARMPAMDGFEVAPLMQERRPGQRILLLSASVDDVVRRRASEAGIQACLGKDDFAQLGCAIRAVAGGAPHGEG